ncbi:unnamed protein product [Fraxinus pennsylvanica]|uniref:Uncharacterized protein n=1 Tax=Fraxinus pennsylvanica TaxID=56036 RepID=A0AAD1ZLZ2_9LAMI|nr:unnamed protein product [Fraxinus pennsylvanica]
MHLSSGTTGKEKSSPASSEVTPSPSPEIAIGIDIGTSQLRVAIWKDSQMELLRDERDHNIKSYFSFNEQAGLRVLRLMHEPTAVALLYAQQQQQNMLNNMSSGSHKVAPVTVTVGGVSQAWSLAGSTLGGEDILEYLTRYG